METAIEAHVVILRTRVLNLFESKEIGWESILPTQMGDAADKLKLIYAFLMKEESQRSKDYDSWKARLRNAMDKIEDEIETYLYNVAAHRNRNLKFAADSWVVFKNKIRLFLAMRQFINTTDGLSKDQYLVHSNSASSSGTAALSCGWKTGGRHRSSSAQDIQRPPPKKCDWSEISRTAFIDTSEDRTSQHEGKKQLENELWAEKEEMKDSKEIGVSVVLGGEGVGKTAITRAVSNTTGIKGRFQCHVWVQMFKEMSYKQLLLRILNQVTHWVPMNPEDMSEHELARLVCQQLVRKSILIVLEDAQDFGALYQFLRGLIDSSSGSRIIITSKNYYAASLSPTPIFLQPLENLHKSLFIGKDFFHKHANLDYDQTFYNTCGGLPLKISLLEKLLLYTDPKDWPFKPNNRNRLVGEELDVYKVCYNKLPPHLKPCFLYLCLFPKSFPIPIRRIIRLWIAEDMIQWTSGTTQQLEDTAECYLHDMVKRNLVEVVTWKRDQTPHTVQMNANLYDKFLPLALTIGMVDMYGVNASSRQFKYVRWYVEPEYCESEKEKKALLSNVVESSGCPRSFISFRRRKGILANDLGRFVKMLTSKKNLGLLRVLDLEGVYKPYLENSLHKLLLLRYLGLRSTGLDSLPKDVGALPYLDTLDIKHTNITRLPSSIRNMSRIRHLDLNGFHFNESQLKHFSSAQFIPSLRTLTGFYVACHIADHIFDDSEQSLSRLTNLSKLGIHFQNPNEHQIKKIADWIQFKLTGLRSLKLAITAKSHKKSNHIDNDTTTHRGMVLPDLSRHTNLFNVYLLGKLRKLESDKLPSCMKVLTLSMSNLVEDDDPMKSLGGPSKFLNLIELRLLAECYKGKKMTCPRGSFQNLKVLKLWKISSLEEIVIEDHGNALNKLEHLEIRYCPNLKIWELANELLNRPKMRENPKLKELIVFSNPDHPSNTDEMQRIKKEFGSKLYIGEHSSSSSPDKVEMELTHHENEDQREHTNEEEEMARRRSEEEKRGE